MRKHLAFYETEWPANIAELTAVENKPFVGYLKGEGVLFTVIPPPTPETWKIYYTSSDESVVTPYKSDVFGANIVNNTYENGEGVIEFNSVIDSIPNNAFEGCSSLTSIVIPDSLTSIGEKAFYGCSSLTSATIPNSVTSIGEGAFGGCYALTSIVIPSSVTSIGDIAFGGCTSLSSITFEGTMEEWNSITKTYAWYSYIPATYVQCSDGQVAL